MNHATARQIIADRIEAITPSSDYVSAGAATDGCTWHETPYPLIPEYPMQPELLAPLGFWVDNRSVGYTPTRSGHDPVYINAAITIYFAFPMRDLGPYNDDWDRSAYALEALVDQLLDPTWAESAGDGGLCLVLDPALGSAVALPFPAGAPWVIWSHPFRILYERT